ncbi:MAG TPA: DUF4105 domain-containing protein [Gemmatimonadales bacterium]|nr:DUF4105 domain-containing protein [Gemmatimonadales bacterium]
MRRAAALAAALSVAATATLTGQAGVPGSQLEVSVITVGPGAAVWERWGHNMIRIHDRRTGLDLVYNYGMFDFAEKGFLLHFLEGRLNYWTAAFYTAPTLDFYRSTSHRSLWEQTLRLTPAERLSLQQFLDWNGLPQNRVYRYDYYRDNCSTRVRDALDRALGGAIARATRGRPTGTTDRDHTRRLTQDQPFLRTGLMLLLGPAVDQPLDEWHEMFLPVRMMVHLREVTVDSAGVRLPLVAHEDTLALSDRYPEPVDHGARIPWFLGVGLLLGALLAAGTGRGPGWWWVAGAALVALVLGLGGAVASGLWALTDHTATWRNQNVLQANLLGLALAVSLRPLAAGRAWARRAAPRLAGIIAVGSVLGLLWHLVIGGQANGDILALLVPVNVGLALGVMRVAHRGHEA